MLECRERIAFPYLTQQVLGRTNIAVGSIYLIIACMGLHLQLNATNPKSSHLRDLTGGPLTRPFARREPCSPVSTTSPQHFCVAEARYPGSSTDPAAFLQHGTPS